MDPLTEIPSRAIQAAGAADAGGAVQGTHFFRRISRQSLVGPLCLALLVTGFLWKLTLTRQYTWIDFPDITRMDVPRLQFQRVTWQHGEFPLWDPHLWCGQPFLGEIVGAAFPLNWPFFFVPDGNSGFLSLQLLNWYFVFLHLIGALAAYWLCRELQLSVLASLLGGFVYTFGGFVGVTLWPEVLSSMVIAPLVFVFLVRALRGEREFTNAALSGMFLGMAWLSGHHEVPIYLSLTAGVAWLYGFALHRRAWPKWFTVVGVSIAIAVLTGGFQIVPGYEYAKLALRWVGLDDPLTWSDAVPYSVDAQYSLHPSAIANLVVPSTIPHDGIFCGGVVFTLVLIAVIQLWSKWWIRLFSCIALGGLLLALGGWNPIHGFLYAALPLFGKARLPVRLLSMMTLGIAPLAAAGLDSLRNAVPAVVPRGVLRTLMIAGGALFAGGVVANQLAPSPTAEFVCLSALMTVLFACTLMALKGEVVSSRVFSFTVLALVFIELGGGGARLIYDRVPGQRTTYLPELTRFHSAVNFLRGQPGPIRINAMEVTDAFNLGDWEGIDTLTGFGAGITENIVRLDWPSVRIQNLLGVGYTLSKAPNPRPDQTLAFRSPAGFNVFKNNDAFPRTWIVHRIEQASSLEALRQRLNGPAFDARNSTLLEGTLPRLQECSDLEEPRIVERSANSVVIDARPACRGMLILSDTWYPGWSARVDGTAVPIYKAYSALRGIVVEAGQHHIELRYRPASAIRGAAMSILGLLGVCVIALCERKTGR